MAGYNFGSTSRDDDRRSRNIGNVTLKIESFDHERNAATGVTKDGEVMSVRLSDKNEFADMFVNRTKHTTQDARERVAAKQTGNRLSTGDLAAKMDEGEGAIQFQSVVQRPDGEMVARWMESIATKENDSYVNASARIQVPRSNQETAGNVDRRRADVIMTDTATAATLTTLDEFTQNRVTGDDDKRLDGDVRSAVLVAAQSEDDPSETRSAFVWTGWDAESKSFGKGSDDFFARPLNDKNWEPMTALAAQVGIPFEDIKFDQQRVNADQRANAAQLYDASKEGHIKVAIAQGFTAELMPRARDSIVESEQVAIASEGRRATMSDRGFFKADVGLRLREGSNGYNDQLAVKQILQNEFLAPRASESYSPRSVNTMGEQVIADAEAKGMKLTAQPAPEPTPAPQPTQKAEQKSSVSMTPDM